MAKTVTVAVTGTAGQIGYSLLPRLASGEVFGPDTRVHLRLYDITPALKALEGVVMELDDCAFSALHSVMITDDVATAFDGINWAILVGSKPRTKGMERGDLIRENGPIFVGQGKALQRAASDVRALVVGNPANTNCMIAMRNAGDVPKDRFSALTRLDHNRAAAQLAGKAGCHVTEVSNVTIWGNHSATQYPDFENAKIGGRPAMEVIQDHEWLRGEFIANVQQRGAAIIAARGLSSAASAANAAIDHIQSFLTPTPDGDWFSAAIPSDGSYGIERDLIFSYPLISDGNSGITVVQDLPMSDFAKEKLRATEEELKTEKVLVQDLLG